MKTNIIGLMITGLLSVFVSCSDWLEEEPKAVAAETFYNTEEEVNSAVLATIDKFRPAFASSYPGMMEILSDYAYGRASWASPSDYEGLDTQNQTRVNMIWNAFYKSIKDCNIALSCIPRASNLPEEKKNAYMAELRFIRALDYFYLVRCYGSCILRTEANMSEYNMGKSSVEDIYSFILSDLNFAEEYAPDKARMIGTPCKNGAKSLLAQVYLELGKHKEAATKAKEVIDSKDYSLVSVSASRDFENVFGANVITTSEEIFYMKSDNEAGIGWQYVMLCAHPSAKINDAKMHGAGGWYGLYTTTENKLISEWDVKDLRKDYNLLPHDFGMGKNTYLLTKYYDSAALHANGAGNSYPLIRYPDVLFTYAEAVTKANGAPTAEAMEALNQIHRRAYGYAPDKVSEVDFKLSDYGNTDQFMKLLVQEHAYECMNEGKRWLFLIRLGIVKDRIKEYKGKEVADKMLLFPIPTSEFNYNEALDPSKDQNPGY